MHHCNQCSKTFTRKSNLRRHQENSCTQSGDGLYLFKSGHGLKKVADMEVADTNIAEKVDDIPVDDQDDDEMTDPVIDPEEVLANKIKDTVEYLIRHDKDEINKLLKKF